MLVNIKTYFVRKADLIFSLSIWCIRDSLINLCCFEEVISVSVWELKLLSMIVPKPPNSSERRSRELCLKLDSHDKR